MIESVLATAANCQLKGWTSELQLNQCKLCFDPNRIAQPELDRLL
jgi:hypothetical protein